MSDEFTVDAKYKRDNLLDEHERYRKIVQELADHFCGGGECICELRDKARAALNDASPEPGPTRNLSAQDGEAEG